MRVFASGLDEVKIKSKVGRFTALEYMADNESKYLLSLDHVSDDEPKVLWYLKICQTRRMFYAVRTCSLRQVKYLWFSAHVKNNTPMVLTMFGKCNRHQVYTLTAFGTND